MVITNIPDYECDLTLEDLKYLTENGKYSETDDVRKFAVEELLEWLKQNPHIHANTSPRNLLRFLRHSKYRMDVCKKRIENFYLMRSKVPEWFQNRDLTQNKSLLELLNLGTFLPLLKKDSSKRTTVIVRATVHNPSVYSQNDLMKLDNMVFDTCMFLDETVNIYGVNTILDLSNAKIGHVLTPSTIKKAVHSWQDCYPVSPKRFDFINAPGYVNVVINVFRTFMNAKLKQRIHIHGKDLASLHQFVPPDILPVEYGGTAGTVQELIDHWKNQVLNAKDWFAEEESYFAEPKGEGT